MGHHYWHLTEQLYKKKNHCEQLTTYASNLDS